MTEAPLRTRATGAAKATGAAHKHRGETHIFDKTRLCRYYAKGRCKRGAECSFAHNSRELMPQPDFFKTQLCTAFFSRTGHCADGDDCKFAHDQVEVRRSKIPSKKGALLAQRDSDAPIAAQTPAPMQQQKEQPLPSPPSDEQLAPTPQMVSRSLLKLRLDRQQAKNSKLSLFQHDDVTLFHHGKDVAFSRQSTFEGTELSSALSRQSTPCMVWSDEFDRESDSSEQSQQEEEEKADAAHIEVEQQKKSTFVVAHEQEENLEIGVEIVVKNTFVTMVPLASSSNRSSRSHSAPPQTRFAAALGA